MSKLPALKPKQVLKALLRAGFYVHHQKGSHVQLHHSARPELRVTIPYHTGCDLPPQILASILQQATISREEFLAML